GSDAVNETSRLSNRTGKFPPSLTLELKRLAAARAAQKLPVWDFGLGETKGDLAPRIGDAGSRAFLDGDTQYGDPAGLKDLRHTVLDWLDLSSSYGDDNVVITGGAKQGLFNLFLALCNPGDTVLLDSAPWVSYQPAIVAAAANPVVVQPARGAKDHLK